MPKRKEDIDEIIDIDLTDIPILSKNTKLQIRTSEKTWLMKPIDTQTYYDYISNEAGEFEGRAKLILAGGQGGR